MYEYRATITRVIDGDTVICDIDLGLRVFLHDQRLRLLNVDAPELSTIAGKQAYWWLRARIEGQTVMIRTVKDKMEKYGRWLATIWMPDGINTVNQLIVDEGHATRMG
jgi:micrococcal nuclease